MPTTFTTLLEIVTRHDDGSFTSEPTRHGLLVREAFAAYRAAEPWSRASGLTCYARVTSCRRIRRCVVCGSQHSESAKYPTTAHMAAWEQAHGAHHTAAGLRTAIRRWRREAAARALYRRYRDAASDPRMAARIASVAPEGRCAKRGWEVRGARILAVLRRVGPLARVVAMHSGMDGDLRPAAPEIQRATSPV